MKGDERPNISLAYTYGFREVGDGIVLGEGEVESRFGLGVTTEEREVYHDSSEL